MKIKILVSSVNNFKKGYSKIFFQNSVLLIVEVRGNVDVYWFNLGRVNRIKYNHQM